METPNTPNTSKKASASAPASPPAHAGSTSAAEKNNISSKSHASTGDQTQKARDTRALVNRLSRSVGHLNAVKRMVENNADYADVLIQLAAVRAELNNAGKIILKEHLEGCITDAIENQDSMALDRMNSAIDKFMK